MADPIKVIIEDEDDSVHVDEKTGTIETKTPDGGVIVQLDAHRPQDEDEGDEDTFYENLALNISADELGLIANDLHEAVQADDMSRQTQLANISRGIDLLGIKLDKPKSSVADDTGAAVDGMSSVTNPLLLDACLRSWANARSELLPAEGPCKISEETDETVELDELAEAFERDMNLYLTVGAPEYYPDTSHMLLWGTIFKGKGFKKIYRCPMRRRPVSESVDAKDLIVSDATKTLRSCQRITHQSEMRKSVLKRMKNLKVYRDIDIPAPPTPQGNQVDQKIASVQGVQPTKERPEDRPYTIWEIQCELDLDEGFSHESMGESEFKDTGIPLPYLVTMDKESREILALRRDWNKDDDQCERKKLYQEYPYIPGPGFYGTGMLNILGNASAAMTAAWREALDAGMLASFPAGLISKIGTRQNTQNFRVGPGEFEAVDTGGMPIQQSVMPLPFHDVTAGLLGMMDKITQQSQQVAGSAEIPAGEGLQNVPVGTMLAQIEQATKVVSAVHKDLHHAQAEEIRMIVDLFREHPEDFWKGNKACPPDAWNAEKLIKAINTCRLVPRSDPNVPSHIHRVMKAQALVLLLSTPLAPTLSVTGIRDRVLNALKEDKNGLAIDPQPQPQGDPAAMMTAQARMTEAQTKQGKLQIDAQKNQSDAEDAQTKAGIKAAELAGQQQIENTRLQRELVIHSADQMRERHDMDLAAKQHGLDVAKHYHDANMDQKQHALDTYTALNPPKPAKP